MESSLRERFARLGPVRAIDRVASGSPAVFVLAPLADRAGLETVAAAVELSRRGIPLLRAKRVLERMVAEGRAYVGLPTVEDPDALARALAALGIDAATVGPPETVDVKAIRNGLGMTQEEFAYRFGLGLDTVQNWESERRKLDMTARSYLTAIKHKAEHVEEALGPNPG
jgi:putative transcriptional regulator